MPVVQPGVKTMVSAMDFHNTFPLDSDLSGAIQPGGGVLPYKRLIGMCRWMGSHFHDWIDYNGVAFSIEFTRMASLIFGFWG